MRPIPLLLVALSILVGCSLPSTGPAPTPTLAPTPSAQPGLFVDASYRGGAINRLVFGSNTGPWQTVGLDQPQLSREAGLSLIRWPGGNWGDENNVRPDQVDEFIALARTIGAEPSIHVRLFEGSPEQAAELVRYVNIEKQYGVRYWAIGNEPDLFVTKRGADSYTVADYVRDFKAFRAAMKAVDPSILILGPEISQYTGPSSYPVDQEGNNWMEGFLQGAGNEVDIVTIHRYPFGDPPATAETLLADPPNWTIMINQLREQVVRVTGREIPLAVTEANSDWTGRLDPAAGTDSHRNALWWADVLSRLIQARTSMVAQFCLGAIQQQGIGMFGPIAYDGKPQPIFKVYQLYHKLGDRLVYASSDDPTMPIMAAKRSDGALTIVLINHANRDRPAPLTIVGGTPSGPAEIWGFRDGQAVAQQGSSDLSTPITLPAESVTLVIIPFTAS
jgi:hypothetical protein